MRDDDEDEVPVDRPAQSSAAPDPAHGQGARTPPERDKHGDEQPSLRPVSADMQQFIGRQLRAVFDDVARQPVPDRFLELMKQLDTKTGTR